MAKRTNFYPTTGWTYTLLGIYYEIISQWILSFHVLILAYFGCIFVRTEALTPGGAKTKLKCILCLREFKSLPALNGHMRSHGGFRTHPTTLKTVRPFTLDYYYNQDIQSGP